MGGQQPFSEVLPEPVVIEKRIVDVEQKDRAGALNSWAPLPGRTTVERGDQAALGACASDLDRRSLIDLVDRSFSSLSNSASDIECLSPSASAREKLAIMP